MDKNVAYNKDIQGLKTIFYGSSTVGKTTIILRLRDGVFHDKLGLTVGLSFVKLKHNNKVYNVWDTAGQERFHSLAPMYFRDASIEIFIFDVTDLNTIKIIKTYGRYAQILNRNKIIVVGNKIDMLPNSEDLIDIDKNVKKKMEELDMADMIYDYVYMSAKSGTGTLYLLQMIDKYADSIKEEPIIMPIIDENMVVIKDGEPQKEELDCVC